ncbi:hypothetical protein AMJ44_09030 [candidate division WOR-1 bacterium DG_54_3]|uniref:Uncharacterized protein n=1 Tax=candidate division WOR-1 bacterium DG_54_3 TaxID=1703775 RepID=A0A0S7XU97_UNCSA|nr:MAG: hypothetical protein AMJ44_09030 [candidate division WOR-1 bacterium DG_54_3]
MKIQEIIYIPIPIFYRILRGGIIIQKDTQFTVIIAEIRHLGDQPTSIGEAGIFVGPLFHAKFNLPDNLDYQELAVIQCRTKHNQLNNKIFLLNHKPLPDILEPHPKNKNEWMMDIAVVPKGWLKSGENTIHIAYSDERYDDFIVDNLVLWYKTNPTNQYPKGSAAIMRNPKKDKDPDKLEELANLDVGVYKEGE